MKIHLIENIYLTSDRYNFILSEYKGQREKEGKMEDVWRPISFHQRPEEAMQTFVNHHIRKSDASTLLELIQEIKELRKIFEDAFEEG